MTQARKTLIAIEDTPYYHITCRCVRRAFLCGKDPYSGIDYEHRRQWMVERIAFLAELFAIDIYAYAIMSNHYHLVIKLNPEQLNDLGNREIAERWSQLCQPSLLLARWLKQEPLSQAEMTLIEQCIQEYKDRLCSLSWFMRFLNQHIACTANQEDNCTGRFWESRFKSQALLDTSALLTCMTYVDLNPIRACMADTPETSDYTSIQARIKTAKHQSQKTLIPLAPFMGAEHSHKPEGLHYSLPDYITLVDQTGRAIRDDKRGFIHNDLPPILQRLCIDSDEWLINCQHFENRLGRAVGRINHLIHHAQQQKQHWFKRMHVFEHMFST